MSRTKRKNLIKQKATRLERVHYRLLIILIIVAIIHYNFFSATMIGGDRRYALCIFWLPTLCGILAIVFYRRKFLMREYQESQSPWSILLFLFYFAQAFLFSYLSVGQIAQISWTVIARQISKRNQVEIMRFPVSRFFYHRGIADVEFKFDGRHEELKARHRDLIGYEEVLAKDYVVEISARKSIWNYYLVDDWEIIKK